MNTAKSTIEAELHLDAEDEVVLRIYATSPEGLCALRYWYEQREDIRDGIIISFKPERKA